MATAVKNFTINKGLKNEFIMTIKQNDSLLPMVIATNSSIYDNIKFTPSVQYVPYQPYVPEVLATTAVTGQEYIASSEGSLGKVEINKIFISNLVNTFDYKIYINDIAFSVTYSASTHISKYGLLIAFRNLINLSSSINTVVFCSVDNETLTITGLNIGVAYSVNTNLNMYSTLIQVASPYIASIVGQPYIAPVAGRSYAPAVQSKSAHYVYTSDQVKIDLTGIVPDTATSIILEFDDIVDSVYANDSSIEKIDNKYDIGSSKKFFVSKYSSEELQSIPEINIKIKSNSIEFNDTFKLTMFNRDTEAIEAILDMDDTKPDGYISIHNNANGQIKIVMNSVLTSKLEKERGPKEDRYYLRPTYRIAIECDTLNNGNFVAKIDDVYVD